MRCDRNELFANMNGGLSSLIKDRVLDRKAGPCRDILRQCHFTKTIMLRTRLKSPHHAAYDSSSRRKGYRQGGSQLELLGQIFFKRCRERPATLDAVEELFRFARREPSFFKFFGM